MPRPLPSKVTTIPWRPGQHGEQGPHVPRVQPGKGCRFGGEERWRVMRSSDELRGVYRKYEIRRTDGSSAPGGKHEHCRYFVLDLEHDEFARAALKAYAKACRKKFPKLAEDIESMLAAGSANARAHHLMATEHTR